MICTRHGCKRRADPGKRSCGRCRERCRLDKERRADERKGDGICLWCAHPVQVRLDGRPYVSCASHQAAQQRANDKRSRKTARRAAA